MSLNMLEHRSQICQRCSLDKMKNCHQNFEHNSHCTDSQCSDFRISVLGWSGDELDAILAA